MISRSNSVTAARDRYEQAACGVRGGCVERLHSAYISSNLVDLGLQLWRVHRLSGAVTLAFQGLNDRGELIVKRARLKPLFIAFSQRHKHVSPRQRRSRKLWRPRHMFQVQRIELGRPGSAIASTQAIHERNRFLWARIMALQENRCGALDDEADHFFDSAFSFRTIFAFALRTFAVAAAVFFFDFAQRALTAFRALSDRSLGVMFDARLRPPCAPVFRKNSIISCIESNRRFPAIR
jgi:hypothetical protein